MAKRNKKIDPAQILLPVVRIAVWVDPTALHGLDAGPVCRCNDSCEYATKSVKHHPLVPHSEWFCTHLAELAGIAAPSCAVIEMPSGENVFGSRWEPTSPAPSPPWWAEVRAGNIPLADIRDALTRIYAFDHFINNTDRHANNFIVRRQKNGHAVLAIDYSRSWLVNGFPLPPPPVYAASHTVTFQRQTTAMWTSYINPIEARSVMEIIKQIPTHRIRNIIEMHPRIWLSDRKKKAILKWWTNGEATERCNRAQNLWRGALKMEHIFKYAILTAIPDVRRGERVNVGIVIFLPERVDVRFSDLAKLRALTGHDWEAYISEARARLSASYHPGQEPAEFNRQVALMETVIKPTDAGWFRVDTIDAYEVRIVEILEALVKRPSAQMREQYSRINTEISKEFKKAKALAKPTESIDDHKVVRDYIVSTDEDLRADFVLKNGVFHVTATLDLRREAVHIKEATWKAVVLDKAKTNFGDNTRRLGVYAAKPNTDQVKSHIRILGDYATDVFNWSDPFDRRRYIRTIYGALNLKGNGPLIF